MTLWNSILATVFLVTSVPVLSVEKSYPDESIFHLKGSWTTSEGQKIPLSGLSGKTLVLAMVYTSCQYSCPLIVQEMARVRKAVKDIPVDAVRYILVSMDPTRDTPAVLQAFAKKRKLDSAQWVLLTASTEDQVREFSTVLGINYKKMGNEFVHSNLITVIDRDGVIKFSKLNLGQQVDETAQAIAKASSPTKLK